MGRESREERGERREEGGGGAGRREEGRGEGRVEPVGDGCLLAPPPPRVRSVTCRTRLLRTARQWSTTPPSAACSSRSRSSA